MTNHNGLVDIEVVIIRVAVGHLQKNVLQNVLQDEAGAAHCRPR